MPEQPFPLDLSPSPLRAERSFSQRFTAGVLAAGMVLTAGMVMLRRTEASAQGIDAIVDGQPASGLDCIVQPEPQLEAIGSGATVYKPAERIGFNDVVVGGNTVLEALPAPEPQTADNEACLENNTVLLYIYPSENPAAYGYTCTGSYVFDKITGAALGIKLAKHCGFLTSETSRGVDANGQPQLKLSSLYIYAGDTAGTMQYINAKVKKIMLSKDAPNDDSGADYAIISFVDDAESLLDNIPVAEHIEDGSTINTTGYPVHPNDGAAPRDRVENQAIYLGTDSPLVSEDTGATLALRNLRAYAMTTNNVGLACTHGYSGADALTVGNRSVGVLAAEVDIAPNTVTDASAAANNMRKYERKFRKDLTGFSFICEYSALPPAEDFVVYSLAFYPPSTVQQQRIEALAV